VAYESADQRWGKDFGAYIQQGVSLYLGHTLRVKVLETGRAFETAGSLEEGLRPAPGLTGREMAGDGASNPGMKKGAGPGPRNSVPRIAVDDQGRVYLTFRSGAGLRSQVGFQWQQYLTTYDGSRWTPAVELPDT
jgi:hypothetical protein